MQCECDKSFPPDNSKMLTRGKRKKTEKSVHCVPNIFSIFRGKILYQKHKICVHNTSQFPFVNNACMFMSLRKNFVFRNCKPTLCTKSNGAFLFVRLPRISIL